MMANAKIPADSSQAWVDDRIHEGLNPAEALSPVKSPVLIIHADWHRTDKGLVGAMDDDDAQRAKALVPHAEYLRIMASHVTHAATPELFTR